MSGNGQAKKRFFEWICVKNRYKNGIYINIVMSLVFKINLILAYKLQLTIL